MAKSYAHIEKQIAALRAQADALRAKVTAGVIAKIRVAIERYQLASRDHIRGRKAGEFPRVAWPTLASSPEEPRLLRPAAALPRKRLPAHLERER